MYIAGQSMIRSFHNSQEGEMAKATRRKNAVKKTPTAKTPSTEFTLFAPEANEIYVVGDFTGWDVGKYRMRKFKTGLWKKKLPLKPGRYEYRFVIDGEWHTDPENISRQPNPFGSENSVLIVS